MSSGFVSGGTIEKPVERNDEWLKAQQEIEEARRKKEEVGKQNAGKSLYEVLEANKAAKQDAFEESTRLKNQFRSLDEDEVEFLDTILESTRAKERAVKAETAAGLEVFRQQQAEAQKALNVESAAGGVSGDQDGAASPEGQDASWSANKKRKRAKEKEIIKGLKVRKSASHGVELKDHTPQSPVQRLDASADRADIAAATTKEAVITEAPDEPKAVTTKMSPSTSKVSAGLGLGAYSSDSDA